MYSQSRSTMKAFREDPNSRVHNLHILLCPRWPHNSRTNGIALFVRIPRFNKN